MEEIQQIADVINSLGEGAKIAFIWWLCLNYGTALAATVVKCVATVVVIPMGLFAIGRGVRLVDDALDNR